MDHVILRPDVKSYEPSLRMDLSIINWSILCTFSFFSILSPSFSLTMHKNACKSTYFSKFLGGACMLLGQCLWQGLSLSKTVIP